MTNYTNFEKGNLVLFQNEMVIIESIHSMNGRTDFDLRKINQTGIFEKTHTTIEKISPILLSTKFLRKNSFRDDEVRLTFQLKINNEFDRSFYIKKSNTGFEFFSPLVGFQDISNLHELQNLFYTIKDYELTEHGTKKSSRQREI